VIARFVEGLRQVNGILAGTVGMQWPRFLGFNALGAVLWVCWWSLLGYFAGEKISEIYDGFERYKWFVIGAAAVIVVAYVAHRVRRRRASAAEKT
jgi:membrane protein DedA with SNARE-associated domain